MSDALDRLRERIQQSRDARAGELEISRSDAAAFADRRGGTFLAGDCVFDTISGREGIARQTTTQSVIVPPPSGAAAGAAARSFQLPTSRTVEIILVDLGGGVIVSRQPDDLVKLPPRPR